MKLYLNDLAEGTHTMSESLPGKMLDLNESTIRCPNPVEVRLTIEKDVSGTVRMWGRFKTKVELECGRCLTWIPWDLESKEFFDELKPPYPHEVDLTRRIREDIVLELPLQAACRLDANFRCPFTGKTYPPSEEQASSLLGSEVWLGLDQLNKED